MRMTRVACTGIVAASLSGIAGAPAHAQGTQDSADSLQEIVVTATRRSEGLQDVPVSVNALSGAALQALGATQSTALQTVVPGLQFQQAAPFGGEPYIRGIGTDQVVGGNESSVAFYVDDVYFAAAPSSLMQFNDISQVEVLKGPQGTLYGRNATGGVINVHTRQPSSDPSMDAEVGYANYGTVTGKLYGTAGLTDTLAVNVALSGQDQRDGWGHDPNTGADVHLGKNYGGRTKLLWTPDATTSATLSLDYNRSDGDSGMNPRILPGTVGLGGVVSQRPFDGGGAPADSVDAQQEGASLRFEHDFDRVRLISISAARKSSLKFNLDQDDSAAPVVEGYLDNPATSYSQELQLQSPTGSPVRWLLGGYYFRNKATFDLSLTGLAFLPVDEQRVDSVQTVSSYAGFADATFPVSSDTNLSAGLRYTVDDINLTYDVLAAAGGGTTEIPVPCPACTSPGLQETTASKITYRAVLDHHFTPDLMAYASYSRGFHSGGYSATAPYAPPVNPEVLDAYEIGFKAELFDHRVRLNGAGFHYNYTNLQVAEVIIGGNTTINAGAARINGGDLSLDVAPMKNLRISSGASVLFSEYTSFPDGPLYVANPATCTPAPLQLGPAIGGFTACGANLRGETLTHAPKFTGNIGLTYTIAMAAAGNVDLNGSYYYNSGYFWTPDNRTRQPSYGLLNLSAKWLHPGGHWDVRLWMNNVTNRYYYDSITTATLAVIAVPAAPRTFGVTIGAHF